MSRDSQIYDPFQAAIALRLLMWFLHLFTRIMQYIYRPFLYLDCLEMLRVCRRARLSALNYDSFPFSLPPEHLDPITWVSSGSTSTKARVRAHSVRSIGIDTGPRSRHLSFGVQGWSREPVRSTREEWKEGARYRGGPIRPRRRL